MDNSPISSDLAGDKNKEMIIRILIGKFSKDIEISAPGGVIIADENGGELLKASGSDKIVLSADKDEMAIKCGNNIVKRSGAISVSPVKQDEPLKVGYRRYRGIFRISSRDGFLWPVNHVELEKYLYGVVPEEFNTTFPEAGKAQAIVARTFTISHLGRFEKFGYDFSSGTMFQVYGGLTSEDPRCTKAVDDTAGLIITVDGKIIKYPLYHSTCGGKTASNEDVFLTAPVKYLRGVECAYESAIPQVKAKEEQESADEEACDITDDEGIDFSKPGLCNVSRYFRWKAQWTEDEIASRLNIKAKTDDNGEPQKVEIKDIKLTKRGNSGRVIEITIDTNISRVIVEGDKIRRILAVKTPSGAETPLYSTYFNMKKIEKDGKKLWTAQGGGWGHGVGMCQYGALGMAKKGCKYEEIIKKYFTGAEIKRYSEITNP